MMMRNGERVKEFLRPFVDSKTWDLCVIWKLGDDPSRFIEWVGCCCSGGYVDKNIKLENAEGTEREKKVCFCIDEHNKHRIRTLACAALSHFPLFMPLYPGIHGEVVMSKSPKWLVNSGPGSKKDMFNTRVLVPVSDGLVELFSFKMKPFDETMVDMIVSRCNAVSEPFPEQRLQFRITPGAEESMSSGVNLSFEGGGSSSVSNHSNETQNGFGNHPNARCGEVHREEQVPCLVMNKEDPVVQNAIACNANKRLPQEHFKSKNLLSERKRRDKINQALYALRAVVPKITKMNKIGIFTDAVDYINELLVEKKKLEDELKGINEKEHKEIAAEEESAIADPEAEKLSSKLDKKMKKNEVNLQVHDIGERDFLIRVGQEHKRGGFKRLIEAVDSCGLEIINVNFSRHDLIAMTVLNVKANKDGIAYGDLRDSLLKMMINQTIDMKT
ncbi:PREDICTED: transcription factor bHLH90-like [Camelina sativa]|uniref:Transcription factor bHLH90-like n=1 Tax=Camelina sativa TaxID=90675 RepID=A0ABM0XVB6_CAMSA|nr:PREDICTED: transcription factor bHLH90-like [Camelina sativa]XP_010491531.1 PREDICTED: transcription factor bHLH90-like [Camelina sativa]XP_010491539.1 PREDICTED: transcription factor bHLH90-like [Camelina sativa]